jgi:hypothetical protein
MGIFDAQLLTIFMYCLAEEAEDNGGVKGWG